MISCAATPRGIKLFAPPAISTFRSSCWGNFGGFAAGNQASANARNLQRFLGSSRVSLLLPDEQTTHHYAQLYLKLRQKGTAIPTNDLWIAALVVQHNAVLCTSDAHFNHLPQVLRC